MIIETIDLYEYFHLPRGGAKGGYLTAYRHGQSAEVYKKIRPAMLVIAGGGYAMVSDREKEPVALRFYAAGYDAFALGYSVAPEHYPVQLLQAGMAMLYLRREAARLELDGEHIAAVGFSAGAHLCGCISVLWDDAALVSAFGKEECERIRPDAALFSYPVITGDARYWHEGSFVNFSGGTVKAEDYSLEKKVRPSVPPCFIWATSEDTAVPAENSLLLYGALHRAGVPAELHIFEKGAHGLSLCSAETAWGCGKGEGVSEHAAHWVELALEFLAEHGFAMRKAEK